MRTKHLSLPPLCLLLLLAACLGLGLNSCTNDLPELEQLATPGTDADTPLRPEDYVGRPVSFSGFTVTEVSTDAATRTTTRSSTVPFGKEGEVVTIRMQVVKYGGGDGSTSSPPYVADYVLSQDGTWKPVSASQNEPLCWQGVDEEHLFTAYYPALNEQEKKGYGRTDISLPPTWTEDNYRELGRLMQSPQEKFDIGSPVSFSLRPLLTRIEVSIDPTTGITDATHLTMYTRMEGMIRLNGTTVPSGAADNIVQEMNLWRSPSPAGTTSAGTASAGTPTDANPVFLGYAIPQTYASGTLLLKHHTPDVNDARSYTVDFNPSYPKGLETKGGEVVSFTVAAIPKGTVHVDKAGGLQAALDAYVAAHGNYPTRLKITGQLDDADLRYLATLTTPAAGGPGANIIAVDMEEAWADELAFWAEGVIHFGGYNGSIKSLVLPSSLSTVPGYAFSHSTLTSVTLPERLTEIGNGAFSNCADLQQVVLSGNESITVGVNAFKDINPSCHLFLYAPGLDATSPSIKEYLTGTWGDTTWANVHWGYKGTGSKLNPENYEHHLNVMP